ncbi:unnamed protein product [Vicia faba]|uniref:Peptidase M17 leucyl aminopeptidase N-terminal domain-containing protein n=1 Tax=Vicia faba TaxID=3906 RepID=A0AAV1B2W4_VICFA|nr:unnamed protein product [Vicia faba]
MSSAVHVIRRPRRPSPVAVTEKDVARDDESRFQNPILSMLDSKLGGLLAEASFEEDFAGKVGQSTVLRIAAEIGSKRVALLGLGASASGPAAFKGLGEAVAAAAKSAQAVHVAVVLASSSQGLSSLNTASAIATVTILGTFEDTRYKTESKKSFLKSVDIIGLGTGPEVEKKLKYAGDVSSGVLLGRELINSPPNVLTPGSYQISDIVFNF